MEGLEPDIKNINTLESTFGRIKSTLLQAFGAFRDSQPSQGNGADNEPQVDNSFSTRTRRLFDFIANVPKEEDFFNSYLPLPGYEKPNTSA